jgi:hypothetical protein
MIRLILAIALASQFLNPSASAQELRHLQMETGFTIFSAEMTDDENFRAEDYDYLDGVRLRSNYDVIFAGAKVEVFSPNDKWGFSTGVRYSQMTGRVSNQSTLFASEEFFFYRFREDGTTTEYLTIEKIRQRTEYLGIPLEVRLYPFQKRRFNLYFKAGGDINFRLRSTTEVHFHEPMMSLYEDDLADDFNSPDDVNATLNVAVGFTVGKSGKPKFGFEIPAPAIYLNADAGGIVRPEVGGGLVIFLSIPLNSVVNE